MMPSLHSYGKYMKTVTGQIQQIRCQEYLSTLSRFLNQVVLLPDFANIQSQQWMASPLRIKAAIPPFQATEMPAV